METPFLATAAELVEGRADGYTIATEARPETTDDEPRRSTHAVARPGQDIPFLGGQAATVDGELRGYSRLTRIAPETTDDDPAS
jgi:hypothetical protein